MHSLFCVFLHFYHRYGPVERLGMDEFFLEATSAVQATLQSNPSPTSWQGHVFTSQVCVCVYVLRHDTHHHLWY